MGLSSFDTQNERDVNDLMIGYFRQFRNHEVYSRFSHTIIVERNFGGALMASWLVNRCLSALPTLQQYHLDEKDGMTTFARLKAEAVMDTIVLLDEDKISIAEKIISHNPKLCQDMIHLLIKQMGKLRKIFEGGRYSFSGKMPGEPDDLCIALLLVIKHSNDATILARLNAEERARLQEVEQFTGYDDYVDTNEPDRYTRRREEDSWQPNYWQNSKMCKQKFFDIDITIF